MTKETPNLADANIKRRLDNLRNRVRNGDNDFFHLLSPAADLDNIDKSDDRIMSLPPPLPPLFLQWLRRPSALTHCQIKGLAGRDCTSSEQEQVVKRKFANGIAKNFHEVEKYFEESRLKTFQVGGNRF